MTLLGGPSSAKEQSFELGGMHVTAWSNGPEQPFARPVILFSHGFHGCATQSRFLMEAFAAAGYVAFAPNHRDATCHGGSARWLDRSETPFRRPDRWDESSFGDRAEDFRRLIEALRRDERFRERVDWSRLGIVGHSLGGYTALALAGAWPGWKLPGVKAVLALSPYSQPFLVHGTLGGLSAPVMYQGGTRDLGITPSIDKSRGAYERSPEPKYFVEFAGAGHFAWTDIGKTAREEIVAYGLAFMNHYVKGEPADPLLTRREAGVERLRYASELGRGGDGPPAGRAR